MEGPNEGGSELIGSSDGRLRSDATRITKEEVKLIVISTLGEVILPVIGDLTRKIVKDEIQIALQKFKTDKDWNNQLAETTSAERRSLQLKFLGEVSLPVLTGEEFNGKGGAAIRLAILDSTGKLVDSGPEASAKVKILVLQADRNDNEHNWSIEDFNQRIIGGGNKGKPHFSEDMHVYLERGMGILCKVKLGHGSMWMKNCLCRLGARVVDNFSESTVKEAWTEPFMVQDCRRKYNKKKEIPSPSDKTWRLHNIWRGGKIDQRLQHEKIYTVEDLLIRLLKDYNGLKNIVRLAEKKWEDMVKNARACPSGKTMCYINSVQNSGVVFNIHGEILGLYTERQYAAAQILSEKNKVIARELFSSAISHWEDIIQFDDESSLQQYLTSLLKPVDPSDSLEPGYSIGPHTTAASETVCVHPDTPFQGVIANIASTQEIDMECTEPPFSTDDMPIMRGLGLGPVPCSDLNPKTTFPHVIFENFNNEMNIDAGTEGTGIMLTGTFVARDQHGELYKKHHPPSLVDEVWRLENIGKDGAFHQRLSKENVNSVQDFLILLFSDPTKLRNILGVGMSAKKWEATVEHAQTCTFDRKLYYYDSSRSLQKNGVVFNMVGQVMGMISNGQYVLSDKLSESEKDDARELVISAFTNRDKIVTFGDASTPTTSCLSLVQSSPNFPSEGQDLSSPEIREIYSQPIAASLDGIQSIFSKGGASNFDDCLHVIDPLDIEYDQYFSSSFPATDNLLCDTDSSAPSFSNDHLQYFETDCSHLESSADLLSNMNSFIPGSVIPIDGAKWGWNVLISILRWWFLLKRIMARKSRVKEISRYR